MILTAKIAHDATVIAIADATTDAEKQARAHMGRICETIATCAEKGNFKCRINLDGGYKIPSWGCSAFSVFRETIMNILAEAGFDVKKITNDIIAVEWFTPTT